MVLFGPMVSVLFVAPDYNHNYSVTGGSRLLSGHTALFLKSS